MVGWFESEHMNVYGCFAEGGKLKMRLVLSQTDYQT